MKSLPWCALIVVALPHAAQAAEVTILCDVTIVGSDGKSSPATRKYILNDAAQTLKIVTTDGKVQTPCQGPDCVLNYAASSISFILNLDKKDGKDSISFNLNRLSGRLVEDWNVPTMSFHSTVSGACQAANQTKAKF